jgi:hypothetical protein
MAIGLFQGCSNNVPPVSAVVGIQPTPFPTDLISNFENDSIYVNSNLLGYQQANVAVTQVVPNGNPPSSAVVKPGVWSDNSYGGVPSQPNTFNNPFVVANTVPDATDSSNYAVHLGFPSGPLTLIATGIGNGYEADQLTCTLENNPNNKYYDATPFTGISFYYNIPADDTNTNRAFQIATINTTANYNHFQHLLPNGTSGGWQAVTYMFATDFVCPFDSCNGALTTTGPLGNLNHIPFIQWQFSNNVKGSSVTLPGAAPASPATFVYPQPTQTPQVPPVTVLYGPETYTDLWVDNVKFVP